MLKNRSQHVLDEKGVQVQGTEKPACIRVMSHVDVRWLSTPQTIDRLETDAKVSGTYTPELLTLSLETAMYRSRSLSCFARIGSGGMKKRMTKAQSTVIAPATRYM
jgi:hypothetical protein